MNKLKIINENSEGMERIVHENIQKSYEMKALHAFIEKQFKQNHLDRSWTITIDFHEEVAEESQDEEKYDEDFDIFDEYNEGFDEDEFDEDTDED